jgi:uroporphyrinogen decarboxylase
VHAQHHFSNGASEGKVPGNKVTDVTVAGGLSASSSAETASAAAVEPNADGGDSLNPTIVSEVLRGGRVIPPPRGEVWVTASVLASQGLPNTPEGVIALATKVGADVTFLSCAGPQPTGFDAAAMRHVVETAHTQRLTCGAVVDGPWQRLTTAEGVMAALQQIVADKAISARLAALADAAEREVEAWITAGADLIILADDLAYSGGPYFAPTLLDRLLVPHYQRLCQVAQPRLPIGFHSDGNLVRLLPALVHAGFSCFSLEPEATSPAAVWQHYGRHLTMLSGIPAAWLTTPLEPPEVLSALAELLAGGSLILASACGLFEQSSVANLREIYRLVDDTP